MTKVINFFGGPGSGKSTTAAGLFHKMKCKGINCELVTEYAKDLMWDGYLEGMSPYVIFLEQKHRVQRLVGVVDYVITDSPILLPIVYGLKEDMHFEVYDSFGEFYNINFLLKRIKGTYTKVGRLQTESEARNLDQEIEEVLKRSEIPFTALKSDNKQSLAKRAWFNVKYKL